MSLAVSREVEGSFPDLHVLVCRIGNTTVEKVDPRLEAFKEVVIKEARSSHNIESLKDKLIFRAYRDFF